MHRALILLSLLWTPLTAQSAELPAALQDQRQFVNMPDLPRALMRGDMIDHLAAFNEIFAHLAENNLDAAGEVAEQRMGQSTIGKHAQIARGQGPGRFMPDSMHQIGLSMHDAASEFAVVARTGDRAKTYAALSRLTSSCVACHVTYRTR